MPYPIAEIKNVAGIETGWNLDPATGVAFSLDQAATGTNYRVTAVEPVVNASDLRDAPLPKGTLWPQLNLPSGMNPIVKQTALAVTSDAQTPLRQGTSPPTVVHARWWIPLQHIGAQRLRHGLHRGVPLRSRRLLRAVTPARWRSWPAPWGFPSRVVVGFTQGSRDADGLWKITVRDAHAWPELWFDGVGWVRFEPTPRGDATLTAPAYAPIENVVPGLNGDDNRGQLDPAGFDPVTVDHGIDYRGMANRFALGIVLVAGLILLGLPMVRRVVRRRLRLHRGEYAAAVEGAWEEVTATAVDLGQPWSAFSTPRQGAERLSRGMSETGVAALRRLRIQVEQVRYAAPASQGGLARKAMAERSAAVRADVRIVVRELRARVRWQVRAEACYWPSSERRRQRSSMRSMKPGDLRDRASAAADGAGAASSTARTRNAE